MTVSFNTNETTIMEGSSSSLQVVLSDIPSEGIQVDVEVTLMLTELTGEGKNNHCVES